jgi:hypothetical protein
LICLALRCFFFLRVVMLVEEREERKAVREGEERGERGRRKEGK